MFAELIPFVKLPANLNTFDYKIPESLNNTVQSGQLVKFKFRQKTTLGLIYKIKKHSQIKKCLEIKTIINQQPLLDTNELEEIKTIANFYNIYFGIACKLFLPNFTQTTLKKLNFTIKNKSQKNNSNQIKYFLYQQEKELKNFLQKNKNKTLILVSELNLLTYWQKIIKADIVYHRQLNKQKQTKNWLKIKNNNFNTVISLSVGVFLPLHNFKKIILINEHDENFKYWDMTPRYHSLDILKIRQKNYNFSLILTDYSPSVSSYYHLSKLNYKLINKPNQKLNQPLFKNKTTTNLQIIDVKSEKNSQNYKQLSYNLISKIIANKNDVALFINSKAYAKNIICADCGYTEICPHTKLPLNYSKTKNILYSLYSNFTKELPLKCPKCGSTLIKLYGFGLEKIIEKLKIIPEIKNKYQITIIDKEHKEIKTNNFKQTIYLSTKAGLNILPWSKINLISILDLDQQLLWPEFNNYEKNWQLIQAIQHKRTKKSIFILPTLNNEHWFFKSLGETDRFYRLDLNYRSNFGYPPYKYLVRYFLGHKNKQELSKICQKQKIILNKELTKINKNIILKGPLDMYPLYYRQQYWQVFILKIPNQQILNNIIKINQLFNDYNWRVDPNPNSVLNFF